MTPNMHPQHQHPHGHHGHSHSMVSAGPPLQFFPASIPITSAATGHSNHAHLNLRPSNTQFFPVNHPHGNMNVMNNQGHHHNQSNNGPQMTVVTASGGHPMNVSMGGMGMNGHMQHMPPVSHHGGHLVMSNGNQGPQQPGNQGQPQNGPMSGGPGNPQMMVGPNGLQQGNMPLMNGRGPPHGQVGLFVSQSFQKKVSNIFY